MTMPLAVVRLALLLLALAVAPASAAEAGVDDFMKQPLPALMAGIEHKHPTAGFVLATRLFQGGQQDEGIFWFYVAQLRYRTYLAAQPGLPASGEPALFSSLMEVMGRPINEYAFGDIPALAATVDRVLLWDKDHDDDFAPHDGTRAAVVDGLRKMKADMLARQAEIRATRTQNGLANRR